MHGEGCSVSETKQGLRLDEVGKDFDEIREVVQGVRNLVIEKITAVHGPIVTKDSGEAMAPDATTPNFTGRMDRISKSIRRDLREINEQIKRL